MRIDVDVVFRVELRAVQGPLTVPDRLDPAVLVRGDEVEGRRHGLHLRVVRLPDDHRIGQFVEQRIGLHRTHRVEPLFAEITERIGIGIEHVGFAGP